MIAIPESKFSFGALVITFNDEKRLDDCLSSLSGCRDLLVVDLGSTDGSKRIARSHGARLLEVPRREIVEEVCASLDPMFVTDWVLRIDPDEVVPADLCLEMDRCINEASEQLAIIDVPSTYFFVGGPLQTTIWGGKKLRPMLFHRGRVRLEPVIHKGVVLRPGHVRSEVIVDRADFVRHYWADSVGELLAKHRRYLPREAEALEMMDVRFSWWRLFRAAAYAFVRSFFQKGGWRGGWRGWFLSSFHCWYSGKKWLSLRQRQRAATITKAASTGRGHGKR